MCTYLYISFLPIAVSAFFKVVVDITAVVLGSFLNPLQIEFWFRGREILSWATGINGFPKWNLVHHPPMKNRRDRETAPQLLWTGRSHCQWVKQKSDIAGNMPVSACVEMHMAKHRCTSENHNPNMGPWPWGWLLSTKRLDFWGSMLDFWQASYSGWCFIIVLVVTGVNHRYQKQP